MGLALARSLAAEMGVLVPGRFSMAASRRAMSGLLRSLVEVDSRGMIAHL
jgi:hypothetical protein